MFISIGEIRKFGSGRSYSSGKPYWANSGVVQTTSALGPCLPIGTIMAKLTGRGARALTWRGGRVVDGSGLENRQAERPRGFESHPLRQLIFDFRPIRFLLGSLRAGFAICDWEKQPRHQKRAENAKYCGTDHIRQIMRCHIHPREAD